MPFRRPGTGTGDNFRAPALLLFAVLAGLFGMHGLESHGTAHPMPTDDKSSARPSDGHLIGGAPSGRSFRPTSPHPTMSGPQAVIGHMLPPVDDASQGARAPSDDGQGTHPLLVLCLAVFFAAWFMLARLRPSARRHLVHLAHDRFAKLLRPVGRDHDPPSLTQLSIRRC